MAKPRKTNLTWDNKNNQFRKCIGAFKSVDGKRHPQRFWLGRDEAQARVKAAAIEAKFIEQSAKGYDYWSENALDELEAANLMQKRRGRKLSVADPSTALVKVADIKAMPEVRRLLDDGGNVRPDCQVEFYKFALSVLTSQDQQTQILLNQVNELWHNDALTTLERISKLNVAPNQVNIGFTGAGFAVGSRTDLDATANGGKSVLDLIEGEPDMIDPDASDDYADGVKDAGGDKSASD